MLFYLAVREENLRVIHL